MPVMVTCGPGVAYRKPIRSESGGSKGAKKTSDLGFKGGQRGPKGATWPPLKCPWKSLEKTEGGQRGPTCHPPPPTLTNFCSLSAREDAPTRNPQNRFTTPP